MPEIYPHKLFSFTSEDDLYPATNLLKRSSSYQWKCKDPSEKQACIEFQFESLTKFTRIEMGNNSSAFVEIQVSRFADKNDYQVLLGSTSLMSPSEALKCESLNRVRCFKETNFFKSVAQEKWNMIKLICTQPFNKTLQYGLSFVKFYGEINCDIAPICEKVISGESRIDLSQLMTVQETEDGTLRPGCLFTNKMKSGTVSTNSSSPSKIGKGTKLPRDNNHSIISIAETIRKAKPRSVDKLKDIENNSPSKIMMKSQQGIVENIGLLDQSQSTLTDCIAVRESQKEKNEENTNHLSLPTNNVKRNHIDCILDSSPAMEFTDVDNGRESVSNEPINKKPRVDSSKDSNFISNSSKYSDESKSPYDKNYKNTLQSTSSPTPVSDIQTTSPAMIGKYKNQNDELTATNSYSKTALQGNSISTPLSNTPTKSPGSIWKFKNLKNDPTGTTSCSKTPLQSNSFSTPVSNTQINSPVIIGKYKNPNDDTTGTTSYSKTPFQGNSSSTPVLNAQTNSPTVIGKYKNPNDDSTGTTSYSKTLFQGNSSTPVSNTQTNSPVIIGKYKNPNDDTTGSTSYSKTPLQSNSPSTPVSNTQTNSPAVIGKYKNPNNDPTGSTSYSKTPLQSNSPSTPVSNTQTNSPAVIGKYKNPNDNPAGTTSYSNVPRTQPSDGILSNVVFVLSGYQNPLRNTLRDKALSLGAKYRSTWTNDSTHLICAYHNTPKFKEVCGKGIIVSEKWILDCFGKKQHLPWRDYRVKGALSPPKMNTNNSMKVAHNSVGSTIPVNRKASSSSHGGDIGITKKVEKLVIPDEVYPHTSATTDETPDEVYPHTSTTTDEMPHQAYRHTSATTHKPSYQVYPHTSATIDETSDEVYPYTRTTTDEMPHEEYPHTSATNGETQDEVHRHTNISTDKPPNQVHRQPSAKTNETPDEIHRHTNATTDKPPHQTYRQPSAKTDKPPHQVYRQPSTTTDETPDEVHRNTNTTTDKPPHQVYPQSSATTDKPPHQTSRQSSAKTDKPQHQVSRHRNATADEPFQMSMIDTLPQLPTIFQDQHFFFYGNFDGEEFRFLKRLIVTFSGIVHDYMDPVVTIVITDCPWDSNFQEALDSNPCLRFIKSGWLRYCDEQGLLAPFDEFEIRKL